VDLELGAVQLTFTEVLPDMVKETEYCALGNVIPVVALLLESATDVAVTATVWVDVILAGAV
jgi:hypothetical protein